MERRDLFEGEAVKKVDGLQGGGGDLSPDGSEVRCESLPSFTLMAK